MARVRRPSIHDWRSWKWEDYLVYFLSLDAAKARAKGQEPNICEILGESNFPRFCEPIRERLVTQFGGDEPWVSIQMPARNDAMELLSTLASYTLLDIEPGLAELIVADNASSDQTAEVIRQCGATYAFAAEPGMGSARRAAYDAMAGSAEYVWLTDSDARVVRPLRRPHDLACQSTILRTNLNCVSARCDVIGLSTGIVYEYCHWLFRCLRRAAVAMGKAPRVHAWTGPNQFIKKAALDAIGGINAAVPYRAREDHQRMYELARYAKTIGGNMLSAATEPALFDPVYHSGRRRGTVREVIGALKRGRAVPRGGRDSFGFPVHPNDRIDVR